MSTVMVLFLLAVGIAVVGILVQFPIAYFVKNKLLRILPIFAAIIVWLICTFFNHNLPYTQFFMSPTDIGFPDYLFIALAGVPFIIGMVFGLLLALWTHHLVKKHKNK